MGLGDKKNKFSNKDSTLCSKNFVSFDYYWYNEYNLYTYTMLRLYNLIISIHDLITATIAVRFSWQKIGFAF